MAQADDGAEIAGSWHAEPERETDVSVSFFWSRRSPVARWYSVLPSLFLPAVLVVAAVVDGKLSAPIVTPIGIILLAAFLYPVFFLKGNVRRLVRKVAAAPGSTVSVIVNAHFFSSEFDGIHVRVPWVRLDAWTIKNDDLLLFSNGKSKWPSPPTVVPLSAFGDRREDALALVARKLERIWNGERQRASRGA